MMSSFCDGGSVSEVIIFAFLSFFDVCLLSIVLSKAATYRTVPDYTNVRYFNNTIGMIL